MFFCNTWSFIATILFKLHLFNLRFLRKKVLTSPRYLASNCWFDWLLSWLNFLFQQYSILVAHEICLLIICGVSTHAGSTRQNTIPVWFTNLSIKSSSLYFLFWIMNQEKGFWKNFDYTAAMMNVTRQKTGRTVTSQQERPNEAISATNNEPSFVRRID